MNKRFKQVIWITGFVFSFSPVIAQPISSKQIDSLAELTLKTFKVDNDGKASDIK